MSETGQAPHRGRFASGTWTVIGIVAVAGTLLIAGLIHDGVFARLFRALSAVLR